MEASRARQGAPRTRRAPFFSLSRLRASEYVGMLAAGVLLASLFFTWFSTTGQNASIGGEKGDFTAFGTYAILDWVLIAACTAPVILAYIIARGHKLSWRPGEVTAIVGITAFALIFCNGIVFGKPGDPPGEISFGIGYLIGLIGAAGIAVSGFVRQTEGITRKPPGV